MNGAEGDGNGGGDEADDVVGHGEIGRGHGDEQRVRVNADGEGLGVVGEERRQRRGGSDGRRRHLAAVEQHGRQNAGSHVETVIGVRRIRRPL